MKCIKVLDWRKSLGGMFSKLCKPTTNEKVVAQMLRLVRCFSLFFGKRGICMNKLDIQWNLSCILVYWFTDIFLATWYLVHNCQLTIDWKLNRRKMNVFLLQGLLCFLDTRSISGVTNWNPQKFLWSSSASYNLPERTWECNISLAGIVTWTTLPICRPCWLQAKLPMSTFLRDFVKCCVLVPLNGVCMRTAFHKNGAFKLLWTHSI